MIQGRVINDEPIVRLTVFGPTVAKAIVVAVIDTCYTQALTLNSKVIEKLGLKWEIECDVILGDGSVIRTNRYAAEVLWHGSILSISVDESEGDYLVGVALLKGNELSIQFRHNGGVKIQPLPRRSK